MFSLPALLLALVTPLLPVTAPPTKAAQPTMVRITIPVRNVTGAPCGAVNLSTLALPGNSGMFTFSAPAQQVAPPNVDIDWQFSATYDRGLDAAVFDRLTTTPLTLVVRRPGQNPRNYTISAASLTRNGRTFTSMRVLITVC